MDKKKLRYAILREIDKGNKTITATDLGVSEEDYDDAIRYLTRNGYLLGVVYADDRPWLFDGAAWVTDKGEIFLEENHSLRKAYNVAKEVREWLRL